MLSDPKYPLLSEGMARAVFERRLRENPANDHLIVNDASAPEHTEETVSVANGEALAAEEAQPSLRQKPLKSFRVKKMIFPMTW